MSRELAGRSSLPRISIITPSLNQGNFISQTIESVLGQNYPHLEYIVIDGGSIDNTLEVLQQYSSRICWISEADNGQSHAINKGIRMASGEVLAYLNSDDIYHTGSLLAVGKFFSSHPEAAWLTGKCRIIDRNSTEIRKGITLYKNLWLQFNCYQILSVVDYISQPGTFWRKHVIDEIGGFDERLLYAMDYDYSLRVGKKYKLWVLNKYLASFRIHPSSKSRSSTIAQFEEDLQVAKRYISSKRLINLHGLHNALILRIYSLLRQERYRRQMISLEV